MLISIITPTYNSEKFIEETIKSVLNQSYNNFEHIIVDGLSTDSTMKIISKYKHLKVLQGKDKNMYEAINKGIKAAKGEIIAYLNSDDLYLFDTFKNVISIFKENNDVDFIYGDCDFITVDGKKMYTYYLPNFNRILFKNLKRMIVYQQSCFWRRELHDQIGFFDSNFNYSSDYEFFCRVFESSKVLHLNKTLAQFRIHNNSLTANYNLEMSKEKEVIDSKYKSNNIISNIFFRFYDYIFIKLILNKKMIIYKIRKKLNL